ncbi:hypothetical protein F4810DRAFT_670135 [Camillea tinctor]|nr:hypothetical protein F4810DRAFT_670135 [Camillea tinctor]
MASKAVGAVAKAAGGVMAVSSKQTVQSTGIWEYIRRFLAVDPTRSNGVPLNPYYRNPPPGALDPLTYDDPVTIPAGDIADNPYWKRDARRSYPRLSYVNQGDAVGLLSVGSAARPRSSETELVGEAGVQLIAAAKAEGQKEGGLAAFLDGPQGQKAIAVAKEDVLVNGLPPLPGGQRARQDGKWDVHRYGLTEEPSYPDRYPCRNFD